MNVSLINYVSHSLIAFFIWLYSLKNQNLIYFFSIVKLVGQLLCSVFGLLLPILIGCLFCSQIRLVVEEGLNQLPYSECTVTTPTGEPVTMVITPPLPSSFCIWTWHCCHQLLNLSKFKVSFYTPYAGHKYEGVKFEKGNCGVSIMRSGESLSFSQSHTHTAMVKKNPALFSVHAFYT